MDELCLSEQRVLDMLIETGMSNKQLADTLHISETTIKTHLQRIYQKFGVSSSRELLAQYYRRKLDDKI